MMHDHRDARQRRFGNWLMTAKGGELHGAEQAARVLEEAVELAQACRVDRDTAMNIVRAVYNGHPGDVAQEAGGVGVTLLACCETLGISADMAEAEELERVTTIPVAVFQHRQRQKRYHGLTPIVPREVQP